MPDAGWRGRAARRKGASARRFVDVSDRPGDPEGLRLWIGEEVLVDQQVFVGERGERFACPRTGLHLRVGPTMPDSPPVKRRSAQSAGQSA